VGFAGCSSDVSRFDSSPFASNSRSAPPAAEMTGSITRGPAAPTGRVVSQPLPQASTLPPPPPKNSSSTGVAAGAGGMASYRPPGSGDITGSVAPPHVMQPPPVAQPARAAVAPQPGPGTVVTVAPGDTVAAYSRRYGVPMATLIKTNNLASPYNLKIGQRIIIPRHGIAAAPTTVAAPATVPARPAQVAAAAPAYGGFHVAGPGDTLNKIAQRYRVSVADLAKANRITTRTQVKLGDRLAIPAQHSVRPAPAQTATVAAPKLAPPQPQAATAPAVVARPQHAALASPTETPEEAKSGGAVFRWPVRGRIITAFGAKPNGQQNDGINIAVPEGTPVKAAEDGEVAYAGNELKGYGNLILVRHPNGFVTAYAHASELLVKRGDKVKRGQVIAKSGRTGNIASPQLHFEIRKGSTPVDPAPYLGA
jgi:murein DD-endopeptidase MepM/ murein hydrolase activator NlpD